MPRYHVFANGWLVSPNNLTTFPDALKRFRACVRQHQRTPRALVSLRKAGRKHRLRLWESR